MPLLKIADDLSINRYLSEILGEEDAIKVMILAINKIIRQNSLDNIKEWYEDTSMLRDYEWH